MQINRKGTIERTYRQVLHRQTERQTDREEQNKNRYREIVSFP